MKEPKELEVKKSTREEFGPERKRDIKPPEKEKEKSWTELPPELSQGDIKLDSERIKLIQESCGIKKGFTLEEIDIIRNAASAGMATIESSDAEKRIKTPLVKFEGDLKIIQKNYTDLKAKKAIENLGWGSELEGKGEKIFNGLLKKEKVKVPKVSEDRKKELKRLAEQEAIDAILKEKLTDKQQQEDYYFQYSESSSRAVGWISNEMVTESLPDQHPQMMAETRRNILDAMFNSRDGMFYPENEIYEKIKSEKGKEEEKKEIEALEKELGIEEKGGESKKEEPKKEVPKQISKEEKERRTEIIKKIVVAKIPEKYKKYIGDLIGKDDEETLRKIDRIPVLKYSAMAFAGSASPESRQFVEDNIENRAAWPWLHFALMGDNTSKGWELRNDLELVKKFDKQGILKGEKVRGGKWWKGIEKIGLHKSEGFEKLVDNVNSLTPWPGWFLTPRHILESTIGIKLDELPPGIKLNELPPKVKLLEKYKESAPRAALECLAGDNSPQAKKLADEIYGKDETHLGDPRLGDVYDAYLKSIEKLPLHEKS